MKPRVVAILVVQEHSEFREKATGDGAALTDTFLLELKERKLRRWLTRTEARQGEGPRAMLWVLLASLALTALAGLALALGWISLPWTG